MRHFKLQLIIAFIVLLLGTALISFVYMLSKADDPTVHAGYVLTSPSPTAVPLIPRKSISHTRSYESTNASRQYTQSSATQLNNMLALPVNGLYTTSGHKVNIVTNADVNSPISFTHSSKRRGVNNSAINIMPVTSFIAMATTREIASPGAQDAPQMASMAPRRAPGPPTVTDDDLNEENQLVEQPIGASWVLLLFALAYLIKAVIKREKGIENAQ